MIVTIADSFRQEGKIEGRLEGAREQQIATLLRLLSRRFGTLPHSIEPRLRRATEAQLDAWLDRVIDAPSLEAVLLDSVPS